MRIVPDGRSHQAFQRGEGMQAALYGARSREAPRCVMSFSTHSPDINDFAD